jgi:hypothetical protein
MREPEAHGITHKGARGSWGMGEVCKWCTSWDCGLVWLTQELAVSRGGGELAREALERHKGHLERLGQQQPARKAAVCRHGTHVRQRPHTRGRKPRHAHALSHRQEHCLFRIRLELDSESEIRIQN